MFKAIQKSKARKGFTLVELIVVISIIAILLLILVPSLLSYLGKARATQAEANAKNLYNACVSIYTDLYSEGVTPTVASLPAMAEASGLITIPSNVSVGITAGSAGTASAVSQVTWAISGGETATWPKS